MSDVCLEEISNCELLGRILNETSQINKRGVVKAKAMYPKLSADKESGREGLFTNKISVLRLCRGHEGEDYSWKVHKDKAESFVKNSDNLFRGFLIADACTIKAHNLDIVKDGHEGNPNHAHIVMPDFNVEFRDGYSMVTEILPSSIRERLDRLRIEMKAIFFNRGDKYPDDFNYVSPSDQVCNSCLH